MNEHLLALWMGAIQGTCCSLECRECHVITGSDKCPNHYGANKKEIYEFIQRVTELIRNTPDNKIEISAEDLIGLMLEAVQ